MSIESISREQLQDVILQLEQALYNHQQWYNSIIRSLVCKLPADRHDITHEAYKECRFGQWYYGNYVENLHEHPGYIALGEEHKQMHQAAAKLLVAMSKGSNISPYDYDAFSISIEKLRLEISTLQRELSDLLYNRDALTGAINKVSMLPILREQQELVKRNIQACSIAMLDLDHFKQVNDQHGHSAGDYVLAGVIRYIIEHMRPYDKIFRVGGEEFILCMQSTDTNSAFEMVERLREGIAATAIEINKNEEIHITASFGIAAIEPNVTIEETIEHADEALYKAKSEGRNCTRIWSN